MLWLLVYTVKDSCDYIHLFIFKLCVFCTSNALHIIIRNDKSWQVCDKVVCERLRVKNVRERLWMTRLYMKGCVWQSRVWKIVCDKVVWWKIVWWKIVFDKVVCDKVVGSGAGGRGDGAGYRIKRRTHTKLCGINLIAGLEHFLFFHILGIIIPTD